jgi:hypothetical protein
MCIDIFWAKTIDLPVITLTVQKLPDFDFLLLEAAEIRAQVQQPTTEGNV